MPISKKTNTASSKLRSPKSFEEIQESYEADAATRKVNAFVYGEWGSGKTTLAGTAPKPVVIDVFDPGGQKSIEDKIRKGEVIADTRWQLKGESGDSISTSNDSKISADPHLWGEWAKEYNARVQAGFFEEVGTYVLDSFTTWSEALLAHIKRLRGTTRTKSDYDDWGDNRTKAKNVIKTIMSLPCHVIVTGHTQTDKDENTGRLIAGPLAYGKLQKEIPLLFDEVYYMDVKGDGDREDYRLHTANDSIYPARSRLRGINKDISAIMEPDFTELLRKAGMDYEDKTREETGRESEQE